MATSELKCSLCSRNFPRDQLRYNPVGGGFRHNASDYLCKQCWQVLCGQPWPAEQVPQATGSRPRPVGGSALAQPIPRSGFQGVVSSAQLQQQASFANLHSQQQAASAAYLRRSQSLANFQLNMAEASHCRPAHPGWQPASMPEVPGILGSTDDPRWNPVLAGSAPDYHRGRSNHTLNGAGSAPVFSPFELKNMMDESSLEIFESQSHLLDPETRLQLQKQRQYLEWQNSMEDSGPLRSCLERTDSAGSGSEVTDMVNLRQELRALKAERETTTLRMNEMCQQMQEKKRQLFSAIQEREQLKERVRQADVKLKEYQEVMHCRLCHTAVRNCVVLPCLHFLYCDGCFKKHCTASPTCPACSTPVTGFQTLILMR